MSITLNLETDVPENRQVVLNLPSEVAVGRTRMVITIENGIGDATTHQAHPPRPAHPKLAQEYDAFQKLLPTLV